MENVLKAKIQGGAQTATGRGISPAYVDVLNRFPLRARDLVAADWIDRFTAHYHLYQSLLTGLGADLATVSVPTLTETQLVGSLKIFLKRLASNRRVLKPHIQSVYPLINQAWSGKTPFVFEKAQALGLDYRYGTYPDVTVSDCSFEGIRSSTEGIVDPDNISAKAAVIKTTYMSSVGHHLLPSSNHEDADSIREQAHEYGTTTGRPRNIHYLDLPFLTYLAKVGRYHYLCPTHLDIADSKKPLKVVIGYTQKGQPAPYRPDQHYLNTLKPVFKNFPSWDGAQTQTAKTPADLPPDCRRFLNYLTKTLGVKLLMATTGPKRHQTIRWF
jgi:adenylosuccinate synthase